MERWAPVKGWELNYEVSTMGRVRSLRTGNFLKPSLQYGYHRVQLSTKRPIVRLKHIFIHRLMAKAFLVRAPGKQWAADKNGIRNDNRIENIYWATSSENMQDKHKHGTMPQGEKHHGAKLKAAQVLEIRAAISSGERIATIAERYNLSTTHVYMIGQRTTWKHLSSAQESK